MTYRAKKDFKDYSLHIIGTAGEEFSYDDSVVSDEMAAQSAADIAAYQSRCKNLINKLIAAGYIEEV